jgi:3-oxoadipate enol-lactonase
MPFYESRGQSLHYETVGAGRPILLVHGFTNYGMVWAPQLAALVHAGYRAIMPDLAGHGLSEPAQVKTTVADLAGDMVALLDSLGIARAAVCGLSLGGFVAQQMAVDHPGRVDGTIVADSRPLANDAETRAVIATWIEMFEGPGGPLKRLEFAWPVLFNDTFQASPAGAATLDAWRPILARIPGYSLANVARGMAEFDVSAALPRVRAPTLVISGELDRLFAPEVSRRTAELVPGAGFAVIPGGGHICSVDSPDRFNRLMLGFMAGLGGRAA